MKKLNQLDEIVLLNHYTILEDIWKEAPDGFKAGVNFKQWMANQISTLR